MSEQEVDRNLCMVLVNGKEHVIPARLSLAALLELLGNSSPATATAVNGTFVPIHSRANCALEAGAHVHCFQLITGG